MKHGAAPRSTVPVVHRSVQDDKGLSYKGSVRDKRESDNDEVESSDKTNAEDRGGRCQRG